MRLVPFEYAGHNPAIVFINPEQVVAVRAYANSTHIYVSAPQKDGAPSYYPVREKADDVIKKLTG
ncbi:hypothetical protein [Rhizobium lentis]|uniref:hypothetical protein n=1 Tax=Rhizobium lentis TaxID=1138194 RepID=UPI001C836E7B|nr:hypothetical protein [Rhizobium lentis]MBX4972158.1 hypothetical protein [Rhizobium lentis]MBX4984321.1 hypothetical protein [Rhizobium lentis]MBX5027576.1 hypothetical protein [Rhizobium lentis]